MRVIVQRPGILSSIFFSAIVLLLISGCEESAPICPTPKGTVQHLIAPPSELATPTPSIESSQVEISGRKLQVDKVVEGALCNDTWSGTVYVKCDVQVYPWVEEPTFLKDCQLNIEPQTVVYVAYHNDTAYYNGCSCHTGVTPAP
ncbi:MAG TPA: hypothetical protein VF831_05810 [Anaerolineales bacterium]